MIKLDSRYLQKFIKSHELDYMLPQLNSAYHQLVAGEGPGNDFHGWINLPLEYDREEFDRILQAAEYIREKAEVLVVVGIGGSYLGARAVIEALSPYFKKNGVEIIFAGHQMSGTYLSELLTYLNDKELCVNVISKSGTTTEPAIAFRKVQQLMEEKYGDQARERIFATTDRARGALKSLADNKGYQTFVIPDDVGGRFSVLTAVGLLPIAVAGIDINELMRGAADCRQTYVFTGADDHRELVDYRDNSLLQYVLYRNALLRRGFAIELLVNYEPSLMFLGEWWKQLYGESEGKDGRGLFPAAVNFSSDLHSMGQYIQDGRRILFETVLDFAEYRSDVALSEQADNADGLNYLAGKTLDQVNQTALVGTMLAHEDGGVPSIRLQIAKLDSYHLGALIYYFEFACGLSGMMSSINPFDQPGVEAYKKNMFALLGKPGFEELAQELNSRLAK